MLYEFCIKLVQTARKLFSNKGLMLCKFRIKLVQATHKPFFMDVFFLIIQISMVSFF